ncbi:rhodanese-related sulfurtransferase [Rhodoligotrophos appendicifer]|uniref:rhodanese-like domain-containing protein n=1 Tax=Rhodoligotrophos appendicifer TaxID=987056 RepID=UPI00118545E8|nr:rhodanese-like domain-containing protein [Rhodoligotrophos appendicifer]
MYKGDVTPEQAFAALEAKGNAVLVDVRTEPEWGYVGMPAVDNLLRISWQAYPTMQVNGGFVDQVKAAGVSADAEIYLLCRSGVRSAAAASALAASGFANAYNVAGGFEGDRDMDGHRGKVNGWKHAGLPWVQG